MNDQNHPIWRFLDLLVVLAIVSVFSYTNASNFDETEYKTLLQVLVFMGGWEAWKHYSKKRDNDEPPGKTTP